MELSKRLNFTTGFSAVVRVCTFYGSSKDINLQLMDLLLSMLNTQLVAIDLSTPANAAALKVMRN